LRKRAIRTAVLWVKHRGIHYDCDICAGVDDVFVFINTFRQAHSISSLPDRMLHTVKAAGKATFFTSFTTAAAFGANIFSSVIYEYRFTYLLG